jgi:hypothetical protein
MAHAVMKSHLDDLQATDRDIGAIARAISTLANSGAVAGQAARAPFFGAEK